MDKTVIKEIYSIIDEYNFFKRKTNLEKLENEIEELKRLYNEEILSYHYLYGVTIHADNLQKDILRNEKLVLETKEELNKLEKQYNNALEQLNSVKLRDDLKDNSDILSLVNQLDNIITKTVFINLINKGYSKDDDIKYIEYVYSFLSLPLSVYEIIEAFDYNPLTFKNDDIKHFFKGTKEDIKSIEKYNTIVSSKLINNNQFMSLLSEKIQNNKFSNCYLNDRKITDAEKILNMCPDIDVNIIFEIFQCTLSDYLYNHIDNEKLIKEMCELSIIQDIDYFILVQIFLLYNCNNELIEDVENGLNRMIVSILTIVREDELLENYCNIKDSFYQYLDENEENIMNNDKIKIAMLKAKTEKHQDILKQFLEIKSVRQNIVKNDNIYEKLLLKPINSEDIEEYGTYSNLIENCNINFVNNDKRKYQSDLINIFNGIEGEYIYIRNGEFIDKLPIKYYVDFLNYIFNGDYLREISEFYYDEFNPNVLPLYDINIFQNILENDYERATLSLISFLLDNSKKMTNLNEEIYWNYLFGTASNEIEDKELIKK